MKAVDCGEPGDIPNTSRFGSSYLYGNTVYYSCDEGYERTSEITGSIQQICGPDGMWHGGDTCKGEILFSQCIMNDNPSSDKVDYSCIKRFKSPDEGLRGHEFSHLCTLIPRAFHKKALGTTAVTRP